MSDEMKTYFVRCKTTGRIKIGRSTAPDRRVQGMRTGCPTELELIGAVSEDIESDLHQEFRRWRLRDRSEWFHPHLDLLKRIETLCGWDWRGTSCEVGHEKLFRAYKASDDRTLWDRVEERYGPIQYRLRHQRDLLEQATLALKRLLWASDRGYQHRGSHGYVSKKMIRDLMALTKDAFGKAGDLDEIQMARSGRFKPYRRNREKLWDEIVGRSSAA